MYQAKCKTTNISTTASTSIVGLTANSQVVNVHTVCIPKTTTGTVRFLKTDGTEYFRLPAATIAATYILDTVCGTGLIVSTSAADSVLVNWYQ